MLTIWQQLKLELTVSFPNLTICLPVNLFSEALPQHTERIHLQMSQATIAWTCRQHAKETVGRRRQCRLPGRRG